jgi:hypothetical protein|tara:strand:+ start:57 stop:707 length:651 start_codon:yes stop_codon:yes gene_type:complete
MALSKIDVSNMLDETLPVANGGTGVTTAANLANTGNLVLLHTTDVTSNTSVVDIDGHFSSDYKNYLMLVSNVQTATDNKALLFRANVGGSAQTGTIYGTAGRYTRVTSGGTKSDGSLGTWNTYSTQYFSWVNSLNDGSDGDGFSATMYIHEPLDTTRFKKIQYTNDYLGSDSGNTYVVQETQGVMVRTLSALSGLRFYLDSSANISNGNFKLYGIK